MENPKERVHPGESGGHLLQGSDGRERGKRALAEEWGEGRKELERAAMESTWPPLGEAGPNRIMSWASATSPLTAWRTKSFHFSATEGKRTRTELLRDDLVHSFKVFDGGWLKEELQNLCTTSATRAAGRLAMEVSLPSSMLMDSMKEFQELGVILYFMGRALKGFQLRHWAAAALGEGAVSRFYFPGKGFYVGICRDNASKYKLLAKGGVWGGNLFAMAVPWFSAFDPLQALIDFCPVWVTFKEVHPMFIPLVRTIAEKMGRVLYMPVVESQYVCSRNITICLIWDMKKEVPGAVKVQMDKLQPFFLEVLFHSFPNACYRCRSIGHYVKLCPSKMSMSDSRQNVKEVSNQLDVNLQAEMVEKINGEGVNTHDFMKGASLIKNMAVKEISVKPTPMLEEVPAQKNVAPGLFEDTHDFNTRRDAPSSKKRKKKQKKAKVSFSKDKENTEEVKEQDEEVVDRFEPGNKDYGVKTKNSTTRKVLQDMINHKEEERKQALGEALMDERDVMLEELDPEEREGELDEKATEQLNRVHKDLHQYYNLSSHHFDLPAYMIITREKGRYFVFEDGMTIEEDFFLDQNNIKPEDITLLYVKNLE